MQTVASRKVTNSEIMGRIKLTKNVNGLQAMMPGHDPDCNKKSLALIHPLVYKSLYCWRYVFSFIFLIIYLKKADMVACF